MILSRLQRSSSNYFATSSVLPNTSGTHFIKRCVKPMTQFGRKICQRKNDEFGNEFNTLKQEAQISTKYAKA
jgi:hypothetical protein